MGKREKGRGRDRKGKERKGGGRERKRKGRGREGGKGRKLEKRGRGERDGKLHVTKAKISAYWLSVQLTLGLTLGLPSASWSDWKDPALL